MIKWIFFSDITLTVNGQKNAKKKQFQFKLYILNLSLNLNFLIFFHLFVVIHPSKLNLASNRGTRFESATILWKSAVFP